MLRQRTPKCRCRDVAPEHAFLVARLLFDQAPALPAKRSGNVVQHARCRLIHRSVTGTAKPKCEIDVLKVAAEFLGEQARFIQGGAAIETGGRAGAEHRAWGKKLRAHRAAVPAFAGDAAHIITIPRAVDCIAIWPG